MDAAFSPYMIYVRNADQPGFIGKLGQVLGDAKVNIATFSLGRMDKGEEAVCLVSVDGEAPAAVIDQIKGLDQVKIVDPVAL
jgi:D-3-phosphoglycerate dehydrogenase